MLDFILLALGLITVVLIPAAIGFATLYAIYKLLTGDGHGHIAHLEHDTETKPTPLLGVVHPKDKDK